MSKVQIKWQAADGYFGKDRPQMTEIEAYDFEGLTRGEVQNLFDEMMEDAFRQKVSWEVDDYDGAIDEIMAAASQDHEAAQ